MEFQNGNSMFANDDKLDDDHETATLEGQIIVWDTIFGFASSMALKAAILLDIPDILASAPDHTLSLQEIAAKLQPPNEDASAMVSSNIKLDYLQRILRFLAHKKIFSENVVEYSTGAAAAAESGSSSAREYRYGLTAASKWLVKESNDFSLAPMAAMQLHKVAQDPWHCFNECVVKGGDAFERANGMDIWNYGNQFPHFNNLFNEAMAAGSKIAITNVLRHYQGFHEVGSMVDVGGGVGLASSLVVAAYPHIKCINFDLPHVVATAPSIPGVEHVGGDFFESVPSADAIFMKWIMHDWDDVRCTKILQNCYKALPPQGKLIIVDVVLSDSSVITPNGIVDHQHDPYEGLRFVFDLVMIAHTTGGRERTREEWHKLFTTSGFSLYKIFHIPNLQFVIEAYKTTIH